MAATSSQPPQIIDGSTLEGGGQILRNAISLSALLHKAIKIEQIRYQRSHPGLKNQHRTGLELAARIASAQLIGASNGSTQVEFYPGKIELPGQWTADSVTAGATTLLLQISLPILLFQCSGSSGLNAHQEKAGESSLTLLGGTNAEQAPQIDYTQHVFFPFFRRHFLPQLSSSSEGVDYTRPSIELEIRKRGYYPKGGGEVLVNIQSLPPGKKLRSVSLLERGRLIAIKGIAHYAKLPKTVGDGMCAGAAGLITEKLGSLSSSEPRHGSIGEVAVEIDVKRESNQLAKGAGSGIVMWAEFENGVILGASAVGRKGIEPFKVGRSAAEELFEAIETGGCVDQWMEDQMIIFMALAEGRSEVRCGTAGLSLHTRTAIWVAEQMTNARFEVERDAADHWVIRCEGIGFTMS